MMQFMLVCYDVCDSRRLQRVAKELENYGTRVQRSVFECRLNESELDELKNRLNDLIDEKEDHVRFYPLCPKDLPGILIDGPGNVTGDPDYHLL